MIWQALILNLLLLVILSLPIQAKTASYIFKDNLIKIRKMGGNYQKTESPITSISNPISERKDLLFKRNNQEYLIKEFFPSDEEWDISDSKTIDLPVGERLAFISFEYLIVSEEDLIAFDNPALYLSLEDQGKKEIIYTAPRGEGNWKQALINLTPFKTEGRQLVFYAGNLGDELKATKVIIKKLSSNLVLAKRGDQLCYLGEEDSNLIIEKNPDDYLLSLSDRKLVYYFLNPKLNYSDFSLIEEVDNSKTLFIKNPDKDIFPTNYLWQLTCETETRILSQKNQYLLLGFEQYHFYPNQNGEVLINFNNFNCQNLAALKLEQL